MLFLSWTTENLNIEYYEQQVDSTVTALASLIEPIMIVVVGAAAGAIIIALYLPIFNLGHAVQGGGRRL
jgi:type IV pilus assembly protein PilC